jgi:hypothetical protein
MQCTAAAQSEMEHKRMSDRPTRLADAFEYLETIVGVEGLSLTEGGLLLKQQFLTRDAGWKGQIQQSLALPGSVSNLSGRGRQKSLAKSGTGRMMHPGSGNNAKSPTASISERLHTVLQNSGGRYGRLREGMSICPAGRLYSLCFAARAPRSPRRQQQAGWPRGLSLIQL